MNDKTKQTEMAKRFRGFLPIVVDVETAGLNPDTDALLEIAAIPLSMDDKGMLKLDEILHCHVAPFENANIDPKALEVNGIDPYHPFRLALPEEKALQEIFDPVKAAIKAGGCERGVLVGHNANFDLGFIIAAAKRCKIKKIPFHSFTTFDTATLSALAFGETVLARATKAAGIAFDQNEAHSAIYDAERTAELFCFIVNRWQKLGYLSEK